MARPAALHWYYLALHVNSIKAPAAVIASRPLNGLAVARGVAVREEVGGAGRDRPPEYRLVESHNVKGKLNGEI